MYRSLSDKFKNWCLAENRKPLILQGQRQVGKSYFIKNLGSEIIGSQSKVVTIDFFQNKEAKLIFEDYKNIADLILKIELLTNQNLSTKDDLLFLDEIQESPRAIEALKYLHINLPQLKVVAAGSYLGIQVHLNKEVVSFPVGYVEFWNMGPLSFSEFLNATAPKIYEYYQNISMGVYDAIDIFFHQKLLEAFHLYLFLGGMPEVVKNYLSLEKENKMAALEFARKTQLDILNGQKHDFVKYAGVVNANHIHSVYEAISHQLSSVLDESVKKFTFSGVIPKSNGFSKIQGPLKWLENARLIIKTNICNKSEFPLKSYCQENSFKGYFSDVGLLQAELKIPIGRSLGLKMGEYKGYIVENFVATQLYLKSFDQAYAWRENQSEIEFLIYLNDEIVPIEVKSSANFSRAKSLKGYIDRYHPKLAIKLAPLNRGLNKENSVLTLPVYLVEKIFEINL